MTKLNMGQESGHYNISYNHCISLLIILLMSNDRFRKQWENLRTEEELASTLVATVMPMYILHFNQHGG